MAMLRVMVINAFILIEPRAMKTSGWIASIGSWS